MGDCAPPKKAAMPVLAACDAAMEKVQIIRFYIERYPRLLREELDPTQQAIQSMLGEFEAKLHFCRHLSDLAGKIDLHQSG